MLVGFFYILHNWLSLTIDLGGNLENPTASMTFIPDQQWRYPEATALIWYRIDNLRGHLHKNIKCFSFSSIVSQLLIISL
jgi:hypothetical protein